MTSQCESGGLLSIVPRLQSTLEQKVEKGSNGKVSGNKLHGKGKNRDLVSHATLLK